MNRDDFIQLAKYILVGLRLEDGSPAEDDEFTIDSVASDLEDHINSITESKRREMELYYEDQQKNIDKYFS